jgi:putative endonuclease
MQKNAAIYIVTNKRNGTLYTGVTSNLPYRIAQHKSRTYDAFSRDNNCTELVFYEEHDNMDAAFAREKQIKSATRREHIELIEAHNPDWQDLYQSIFHLASNKR